jgi:hypothetical protein
MKTYLSLDLDFWNKTKDLGKIRIFLEKVKELKDRGIPVLVVDSHEELTKDVNRLEIEHLINVDYHSDIWDRWNPYVKDWYNCYNCGTWINFVKKSNRMIYTWVHPHKKGNECLGYCSHRDNPFYDEGLVYSGWKVTEMLGSTTPEKFIRWENVISVGIAFSYDWIYDRSWRDKVYKLAKEVIGDKPRRNYKAKLH